MPQMKHLPAERLDALNVERIKRQKRFSAKAENRVVVVTEAGSYLRLIDSCVTQLKAQGPFSTCNERKEEDPEDEASLHSTGSGKP